MTPPLLSALYAGLNALILLWLTVEVIRRRGALKLSLGDGGDAGMNKVIRGHANAAETMPVALILLALAELTGAPAAAIHAAGLLLTLGRLLHGLHFTGRGPGLFRIIGMASTLMSTILLALGLVAHSLMRLL